MKNLITILLIIPVLVFGQSKFTETTFADFNKKFKANPIETLKNNASEKLIYVLGNGRSSGYQELLAFYGANTENERTFPELTVYQVGNTAVATGVVDHSYFPINNPSNISHWIGKFTYTYGFEKGKWLLVSAQHTDFIASKDKEEAAIKNVIEGQTQASYDRNLEKSLSFWANVPYASYVLTSLNANLTGFEQIKNTYTFFMKANPTPDKSKIEASYKSITIKGNSAFVKHEEAFTSEKGITTKQNCHRYLEKINNEWKLVGSVVTPMPTVKTNDEVAIKKVIEAETQAYLDGDGKKLLSYWADKKTNESASQSLIPYLGQPFAKGESMEKLQTVVLPNLKKQDIKIERDDFEIRINKDMAWVTYTQKAIANGNVAQTNRETRILERIGGEWKIVFVGEQGVK